MKDNLFLDVYKTLVKKPKQTYSELLQEYYYIHEASKPYTKAEAKSGFFAFCQSKIRFTCPNCGKLHQTQNALNGHKKGCKI